MILPTTTTGSTGSNGRFQGHAAGRQGGGQHPRTLRLHRADGGGALEKPHREIMEKPIKNGDSP